MLRGEGFRPPIIQDERFDPAEAFEQLAISPVATRQGESTKEAWNTLVKDGDILPAGLLAESAGKPAFAGATRSCDDEASPLADPVAGGELEEQRAIETARGAIIDIFDAGGLTETRHARPRLEAFLPAQRRFLVEKQAEPFGMFKTTRLRIGGEFLKPLRHAVEAEGMQLIECRMRKHEVFPFN